MIKLLRETSEDEINYLSVQPSPHIWMTAEKFWRSISPSWRSSMPFEIDVFTIHSSTKITNLFNTHFQSVFTKENSLFPNLGFSLSRILDIVIRNQEILNLLLQVNMKQSRGPAGIKTI